MNGKKLMLGPCFKTYEKQIIDIDFEGGNTVTLSTFNGTHTLADYQEL